MECVCGGGGGGGGGAVGLCKNEVFTSKTYFN